MAVAFPDPNLVPVPTDQQLPPDTQSYDSMMQGRAQLPQEQILALMQAAMQQIQPPNNQSAGGVFVDDILNNLGPTATLMLKHGYNPNASGSESSIQPGSREHVAALAGYGNLSALSNAQAGQRAELQSDASKQKAAVASQLPELIQRSYSGSSKALPRPPVPTATDIETLNELTETDPNNGKESLVEAKQKYASTPATKHSGLIYPGSGPARDIPNPDFDTVRQGFSGKIAQANTILPALEAKMPGVTAKVSGLIGSNDMGLSATQVMKSDQQLPTDMQEPTRPGSPTGNTSLPAAPVIQQQPVPESRTVGIAGRPLPSTDTVSITNSGAPVATPPPTANVSAPTEKLVAEDARARIVEVGGVRYLVNKATGQRKPLQAVTNGG